MIILFGLVSLLLLCFLSSFTLKICFNNCLKKVFMAGVDGASTLIKRAASGSQMSRLYYSKDSISSMLKRAFGQEIMFFNAEKKPIILRTWKYGKDPVCVKLEHSLDDPPLLVAEYLKVNTVNGISLSTKHSAVFSSKSTYLRECSVKKMVCGEVHAEASKITIHELDCSQTMAGKENVHTDFYTPSTKKLVEGLSHEIDVQLEHDQTSGVKRSLFEDSKECSVVSDAEAIPAAVLVQPEKPTSSVSVCR